MNAPTKIHLDVTINNPKDAVGEIAKALADKLDILSGKRLPDGVYRIDGTDILYTMTSSVTHYDAPDAVSKLEQVPGHDPWEMGTLREAALLIEHGKYNPAVDTEKHPGIKSESVWINKDPYKASSLYAWFANFDDGIVNYGSRSYHFRALAVCRPVSASQQ